MRSAIFAAGRPRVGDRKIVDAPPPGAFAIRRARLDDLDAIVKLECESFAEDRVSRRALRNFLRAPQLPIHAAVMDDELVGYALVSLRKRARAARIYSIAVATRFARRGIGLALLQASEKYALMNGRTALRLEVRYDNAPAIALYEKFGFRQFGEHVDYYADGATALRYEKTLVSDPKRKTSRAPNRLG